MNGLLKLPVVCLTVCAACQDEYHHLLAPEPCVDDDALCNGSEDATSAGAPFGLSLLQRAASVSLRSSKHAIASPSGNADVHAAAPVVQPITDLIAVDSNFALQRSLHNEPLKLAFVVIIPVAVVIVLILLLVVCYADDWGEDSAPSKPISGTVVDESLKQKPAAPTPKMGSPRFGGESPMPSHRRAQQQQQQHGSDHPSGNLPAQSPAQSPPVASAISSAMSWLSPTSAQRSPRLQQGAQRSPRPRSPPRNAGTPLEVRVPGMPPQLCPAHPLLQAKTTLKVSKDALPKGLLSEGPIEVLGGGFDYPVAYARLGTGPEGRRLEMATEPSWKDVEIIVGPVERGHLGDDAAVYGPDRELYGPFQRTATGFSVGHYSSAGSVLTLTPKHKADGICIEVNSEYGKPLASVTSQARHYQIEMVPGVDANLLVASILATVIASPTILDEMCTTL